jgi:hypothetical protein
MLLTFLQLNLSHSLWLSVLVRLFSPMYPLDSIRHFDIKKKHVSLRETPGKTYAVFLKHLQLELRSRIIFMRILLRENFFVAAMSPACTQL